MSSNIWQHTLLSLRSAPLTIFGFHTPFPEQVVYLLCNIITQYVCISSVYVLTAECTSLTVTLVVTLRKFFSILVSVVYFKNEFTLYHWLGTLLVFTGTAIFTEVIPSRQSLSNLLKSNKALTGDKNGKEHTKGVRISSHNKQITNISITGKLKDT